VCNSDVSTDRYKILLCDNSLTLQTAEKSPSTPVKQARFSPTAGLFIRMNTRPKLLIFLLLVICGLAAGSWWLYRSYSTSDQQLSVQPDRRFSKIELEPVESTIGLHARLPYQSIIGAAEHATKDAQTGAGEKQACKKLLGAKVCATLQWNYVIARDGEVKITPLEDKLQLRLPVSFSGQVSVDGRGGKLLGLRNKDIGGKLELVADLKVYIKPNWCPAIDSTISYEWRSDPKIRLVGGIKINLRKSVDKALQSKLQELQTKLATVVDCSEFRQAVQKQWRTHTLPVKMKHADVSDLHITPLNASVSEIGILPDHVGIAFELGAIVELLQSAEPLVQNETLPLPDLTPETQNPGIVEFSLLLEIPYQQLNKRLSDKLLGQTYSSGKSNALTVTSVDLYPSDQLLIIEVGFNANAVGSLLQTTGRVYISTKPVANPADNTLKLQDLQLTRTIDSKLLSALTTILRQQLLTELNKISVVDLQPTLNKLEGTVQEALGNPDKTGGLIVAVEAPEVRLMALNPQSNGLAAIVTLLTPNNAKRLPHLPVHY